MEDKKKPPTCYGEESLCKIMEEEGPRDRPIVERYEITLTSEEAMALGAALDWLREHYGPIYDPVLSDIKRKLSKAIRGY